MSAPKLDAATLRRLAVRASVCPSTIQKVFLGQPVRGLAGHRARQVLREAGIAPQGTGQLKVIGKAEP